MGDRINVDIERIEGAAALVLFVNDDGESVKAIVPACEVADLTIDRDVLERAVLLPNWEDAIDPDAIRARFEAELLKIGVYWAADLLRKLPAVRRALLSAMGQDMRDLIGLAQRQIEKG